MSTKANAPKALSRIVEAGDTRKHLSLNGHDRLPLPAGSIEAAAKRQTKRFLAKRGLQRKPSNRAADPLGEPTLQCPECDKRFHLHRGLNTHMGRMHQGVEQPDVSAAADQ